MVDTRHLLLSVPDEWSTEQKGSFYEGFVSQILGPMRYSVDRRLRVTGMELDLLAKGLDAPQTVLVECKAHRDPIAAEVITKLLGNVQVRGADRGWLFTTSDLTKDGRGLWEEIQNKRELAQRFTWFSPARTIEVLIGQQSIVDPSSLSHTLPGLDLGDWSLIVTPGKWSWLVEILEEAIPTKYSVFDAKTGIQKEILGAREIAASSARYAALQPYGLPSAPSRIEKAIGQSRAPVARVISGDAWDDPRPARPIDFVGRDDTLESIVQFIDQARLGATSTRSFALLAPSGWGKSSLVLKLAQQASGRRLPSCSLTAVDSRSANSAAFVAEALSLSLSDATSHLRLRKKAPPRIQSLREPLSSPDVQRLLQSLKDEGRVAVLIFDQFEELFAKESLFEVFNAVRDLSLDVDATQSPLILGFAWKTDVSLPQQHPAYHLWHQLADRRRTFRVSEFGRGEVERVVSKAERALGKRLSRVLRSRLAEQCQGLPWLLKKLLVHVLQRISTPESQYLLLERELDVEQLFKEDLEQLQDEHLRCLKFVASRAPVAVAEVEENFARDTTNLLLHQHLLVRSGMNYVVYWDIFRDYLTEERVPEIPWARTFQRMPPAALKALGVLATDGPLTAAGLGRLMALKEGPTFNVLGDLVALQLVEADGTGLYHVATHLTDLSPGNIAKTVRAQLRRHVIARDIERSWVRDQVVDYESWVQFFGRAQPRSKSFTQATLRQYAGNLKAWLVFSGLLEIRARGIARADGTGSQMGIVASGRSLFGVFLGTSAPRRLEELLEMVFKEPRLSKALLESKGLRNACADAIALEMVTVTAGEVAAVSKYSSLEQMVRDAKDFSNRQPLVLLAQQCLLSANGDRKEAASLLAEAIGAGWKQTSSVRYLGGLLRYAEWGESENAKPN